MTERECEADEEKKRNGEHEEYAGLNRREIEEKSTNKARQGKDDQMNEQNGKGRKNRGG